MGQKSELRNYASYGGKILGKKSELRNYASYGGKIFSKNLSYVITPITVTIFRGKKLNYVIMPGLKKNFGQKPQLRNYVITQLQKCQNHPFVLPYLRTVETRKTNVTSVTYRSRKLFSGYLAVGYIAKDSWLYSC